MKSLNLKIGKNDYTIPSFPNVDQMFAIAALQTQLSRDSYSQLAFIGDNGLVVQMMVDMVATFKIMVPALEEDLKFGSLLKLEYENALELLHAYANQYLPWYHEMMDEIGKNVKGKFDIPVKA